MFQVNLTGHLNLTQPVRSSTNKCKVVTVKRNPEGSRYTLITPMDTDLLKLPNSTSESNYNSVPNLISNPEIIVVQQLVLLMSKPSRALPWLGLAWLGLALKACKPAHV